MRLAAVHPDTLICFMPPTLLIAICSTLPSSALVVFARFVILLLSESSCLLFCFFVCVCSSMYNNNFFVPLFLFALSCQILELFKEPCCFPPELNEVHHQLALPPVPLHCGLCLAGDAALWRTVSDLSNLICSFSSSFQPFLIHHTSTNTKTNPLLFYFSTHFPTWPFLCMIPGPAWQWWQTCWHSR